MVLCHLSLTRPQTFSTYQWPFALPWGQSPLCLFEVFCLCCAPGQVDVFLQSPYQSICHKKSTQLFGAQRSKPQILQCINLLRFRASQATICTKNPRRCKIMSCTLHKDLEICSNIARCTKPRNCSMWSLKMHKEPCNLQYFELHSARMP